VLKELLLSQLRRITPRVSELDLGIKPQVDSPAPFLEVPLQHEIVQGYTSEVTTDTNKVLKGQIWRREEAGELYIVTLLYQEVPDFLCRFESTQSKGYGGQYESSGCENGFGGDDIRFRHC
jgi:hypothetical protein